MTIKFGEFPNMFHFVSIPLSCWNFISLDSSIPYSNYFILKCFGLGWS